MRQSNTCIAWNKHSTPLSRRRFLSILSWHLTNVGSVRPRINNISTANIDCLRHPSRDKQSCLKGQTMATMSGARADFFLCGRSFCTSSKLSRNKRSCFNSQTVSAMRRFFPLSQCLRLDALKFVFFCPWTAVL